MASVTLRVIYTNGETVDVRSNPRAQVETERALREQGGYAGETAIEVSHRLAFESLRSRRMLRRNDHGNDPGYEEWLDSLEDVDDVTAETAAGGSSDPTPETPSPTPSSD